MPVKYKLNAGDTVDITAITKTNQGSGSGLDSDLLDGLHGSAYEQVANKGVASGYASLNASSLVVQNPASKGQPNGLAELDAGGKVPSSQLPALALTDVWTVASEAEQLALTAQEGDMAIRTDQNKSYAHNGGTAGTMADWSLLLTPTDAVLSVFGRTGAVVAQSNDYNWGQIDKAISSLADITTKSHTVLSDIGSNTHAQIDTHLGAASPHSGHEVTSAKNQPSGYAGLDINALLALALIPTTLTGKDADSVDSLHGADLEKLANKNTASGYPGLSAGLKIAGTQITYGSLINTACEGNDSRLSDARTPTAHASTHNGGADPVTPSGIGAIAIPGSSAWGDILFRDTSGWTRLPAGTSGLFLKTQGVGANPVWASGAGGASTFLDLTDTPSAYTGAGRKLVRVNAGATALEFLNETDKLLLTTQITVGASAAHDNNYMLKFEDTSVTWGGLLFAKDTRTDPSGQRVLTFRNNVGGTEKEIYLVDNLGAMYLDRYVEWGYGDLAKHGRLAIPAVDGFVGLSALGTDANISLGIVPKGTGVIYLGGGTSGLEVDTTGYLKPISVSLPTADSTYRGKIARVQGTPDELYICQQGASTVYNWQKLGAGEGHITILSWAYSAITQGTWAFNTNTSQATANTFYNSTAANLDQVDYKVYLAPGTYSLALLSLTASNRGIMDILLDGTSLGTTDMYSASTVQNVIVSITGIVVAIGGLKTLSVKVNGKNASSTGYYIDISSISLWRTA